MSVLQISNPNEFDIMLKVPDMRVELEPCNIAASGAFFYVKLKRNPGEKAYLAKFLDDKMHLSSSDMLSALRNIIVEEVKKNKGKYSLHYFFSFLFRDKQPSSNTVCKQMNAL